MSRGTSPGSRRSEATLFPLPSVLVRSDHASGEGGQSPKSTRRNTAKEVREDGNTRANPFPEVRDRTCRLPLPTLF
ncbi:hypothetical protein TNCT_191071 [Trichonephila clavata]|uniref:Uncharacterized protein n=1 Tax=Trichonephila clavata TaxID=2740835 RepID=A0A8X6G629_TRICU|nr:hypothetical protein TNCT_191071 [Trichonephila clavata]